MGVDLKIRGVTFDSLRRALTALYFQTENMTEAEFGEVMDKSVVPMQHNWMNPLQPGSGDTVIQYWINSTDRYTQDWNDANRNISIKVASCTVRFLGVKAEQWAIAFHHLTQRRSAAIILETYCNARALEYIGPITVSNVDYFGAANATKAFTLSFKLQYEEELDFTDGSGGDGLEYVSFASGAIDRTIGG